MSEQPPKNKLFDNAPGNADQSHQPDSIATNDEIKRVAQLRAVLPKLLERYQDRGRAQKFEPYLLVRSVLGDRGDRPLNVPFWESPDIWTAEGNPQAAPEIPPDPGGVVAAGKPATVYAHVWNLGRAPLTGVRVEFYWFDPSLVIDGSAAHLIGVAGTRLAPRNVPGCHRLVKCPIAWTPTFVNGGHECLVVRLSGIGDPIGTANPWSAAQNRHVAQRNIHVNPPGADLSKLIAFLTSRRLTGTRVQLIQVGQQGKTTVELMAPGLKIDPQVNTQVLAELRTDGSLHIPSTTFQAAGALAPIHVLSSLNQPDLGRVGPLAEPRVQTEKLLGLKAPAPARLATVAADLSGGVGQVVPVLSEGGTIAQLVQHEGLLAPEVQGLLKSIEPPKPGLAQVLRMASYVGDQLVGGYTIIIGSRG
jgi:hypothetical protein